MKAPSLLAGLTCLALIATPVFAASGKSESTAPAADDTFITLSGKVSSITDADEFTLNYGGGQIKVDTNDAWPNLFKKDANNATSTLSVNDRVIVSGRMDDNWFGDRELDAYSLRHEHGGKIFNYEASTRVHNAPDISKLTFDKEGVVNVTGTITQVMNNNRYQMRYPSGGTIEIDTTGITGGKDRHFKVGDRVIVSGKLDDTFFGKREINVDTIQLRSES